VSCTVEVIGVPTPTLQWRLANVPISGATFATLEINPALYADNGKALTCVASNSVSSVTSTSVILTVNALPPTITTQPVAVETNAGKPFTLSVVASGTPTPTYQWRKNGTNITGATQASYVINRASLLHNGVYTCVVSNVGGSVTSDSAAVTIQLTTFAVLTELFDLSSTPPERIIPTPAHYGLGTGDVVNYNGSDYVPVGPQQPLTIGETYFLDNGAIPNLISGFAPAPLLEPATVTLINNEWKTICVTFDNTIKIGDDEITLDTWANSLSDSYIIWYMTPDGVMKRLASPDQFVGGTNVVIPAGSVLWIKTADAPPALAPGAG
jgi:hypothetical protein